MILNALPEFVHAIIEPYYSLYAQFHTLLSYIENSGEGVQKLWKTFDLRQIVSSFVLAATLVGVRGGY